MRRVILAAFLATGACLIAAAGWRTWATLAFLRTAQHAAGQVIDPGPGGRHASVTFQASAGRRITFQSQGLIASVRAGQSVPVVYAQSDPESSARIEWLGPLFLLPVILGFIGIAMVASSIMNMA